MNSAYAEEAKDAYENILPDQKSELKCGHKLYLGHEQRVGWSAPLPFFLFRCGGCGDHAKDYPHGFAEKEYLLCSSCGKRHSFETPQELMCPPPTASAIYKVVGPAP